MRSNAYFEKCAFIFIFTILRRCYINFVYHITENKKIVKKYNHNKFLPKNASTSDAIPRIAT